MPVSTARHARQPQQTYHLASERSEPLPSLSALLSPVPRVARHFLPAASARRPASRRNHRRLHALPCPAASETETESELDPEIETPAEDAAARPVVPWAERRKRVVVVRRVEGKVALDDFGRLEEVHEVNALPEVVQV